MDTSDVTESTEETGSDVSQTSEVETTNDSLSEEDSSSSEDVNTQSEEGSDEVVDGAMDEVKSDKGVNRVQELANERKALAEENKALREKVEQRKVERRTEVEGRIQNGQVDGRTEVEMTLMKQELNDLKIQTMYQKAEAEHPELDKNSENYDVKFDDFVYRNWLVQSQENPTITPSEIATDLKGYLKGQRDAGAKRAENQRQIKQTVTTGRQTTNTNDSGDSEYNARRSQFGKTGSIDDLAELM